MNTEIKTYPARCYDAHAYSAHSRIQPAAHEQERASLVQANAEALAGLLEREIRIDQTHKCRKMLSYKVTHAKNAEVLDSVLSTTTRLNSGYGRRPELPAHRFNEGQRNFYEYGPCLSDHERTLYVRGAKDRWVVGGHISSPYLNTFIAKGKKLTDVKPMVESFLSGIDMHALDDYTVIVLDEYSNVYYPLSKQLGPQPRGAAVCSIVIVKNELVSVV